MRKRKRLKSLGQWIKNHGVIAASVTILLSVDLALNMVSMSIISTGGIERLGFVCLGVVIVALGVPSYFRGFKGLWLTFAILSAFLNTSFTLESTRIQSLTTTIETDSELLRLTNEHTKADATLSDLRLQYKEAAKRETMDQLDSQITAQIKTVDDAKHDRDERFKIVQSGGGHPPILGKDVFVAIPKSVGIEVKASYIELPFFAALFFGVQRAIVIFATNRRREPKIKPESKSKPVTELFEDVTDAEYIDAARLRDGSVKPPEDLAVELGITPQESHRKHAQLFSGFAYENGRYVRKS